MQFGDNLEIIYFITKMELHKNQRNPPNPTQMQQKNLLI